MRWLVIAAVVAAACGDDGAAPREAVETAAAPAEEPAGPGRRAELVVAADARRLSETLRAGAQSTDPEVRRGAVLGLARLHEPEAVPLLRAALRDPDPAVRRAASLGLGAFEDAASSGVPEAILAALAAERETDNRAAMLWDLARVAGDEGLPALREGLAANEPPIRAAACRGLGFYGLRGRALEPALLRRIAARMVDDADPGVRLACSYALTRLAPPVDAPEEAAAVVEDLARAADDEDPEVRAMAVRALGRYPSPPVDRLVARTADPDWRVAVQAFRSLGRLGEGAESAYARALQARLSRALAPDAGLRGAELHVLLTALESAAPFARGNAVHPVATAALARIEGLEGEPDRDRGLAHCGAAALVDRGRGWPTRLMRCGLGRVSEPERQVVAATVLGELPGAERERLALLERLYRGGDARVRQAVITSATGLPLEGAAPLVLEGLRSEDSGVVTTALDAIVTLAPTLRAEPAPAPVLSVRPAGTPLPEPGAPVRPGPTPAELARALSAAWTRLQAEDEVEGLQSFARAVAATGESSLADEVGSLVLHPVQAVRDTAREALETLRVEPPAGEVRPIANPVAPPDVMPTDRPVRAVLRTGRGDIELELLPAEAPTTVARFVALAQAGFFDGLSFHRVVPAFVVQGGDPRGDGYGGPGWTQRCEDNRLPYGRGTVGMALAGRDTGGSQFFIAHSAQPHLDGRYTAFGRVLLGLDVLDTLQAGDPIRTVEITRDDGE